MATASPDVLKVETHIVEMTNKVRADAKLAQLKPSASLAKAARAYAEYLARSGQFSHTADGQEPGKRAENTGYTACEVAENIALQQSSAGFEARDLAAKVMTGWINSPGHRANILGANVTEIGVGIAKSADAIPKFISVQLFGRPASAALEFQIVNASPAALTYKLGGKPHDIAPHLSVTHKSCRSATLVFERPGGWLAGASEIGRVEAEDGKLYTLETGSGDTVVLNIGARRKIK